MILLSLIILFPHGLPCENIFLIPRDFSKLLQISNVIMSKDIVKLANV